MNAFLKFFPYKYFDYEKRLSLQELMSISDIKILSESADGFEVEIADLNNIEKLVYFEKAITESSSLETWQSKVEKTCPKTGNKNRQSTRYSAHGLHEYKGKFNPQIVGGLLNILNVTPQDTVLDPFGGSGTTISECALRGVSAIATDINPLAVKIANAKITSLRTPYCVLKAQLDEVEALYFSEQLFESSNSEGELEYLRKWFPENKLHEINRLRPIIERVGGDTADIFLCLASDLLREHSLQDPGDLRIRRRKTPVPAHSFVSDFLDKANSFVLSLKSSQKLTDIINSPNVEVLGDSRDAMSSEWIKDRASEGVDALITSPPYATALPYIDSQRLSLVWLGLSPSNELLNLEESLIGSREMRGSSNTDWRTKLQNNTQNLPKEITVLCSSLEESLLPSDGFRKRAVPPLLYRYFSGMKDNFLNCASLAKKNAPYALVVGQNATTIGGRKTVIDTPSLLACVAEESGWVTERIEPLNTYHRFGIHQSNSIKTESLIILRRK